MGTSDLLTPEGRPIVTHTMWLDFGGQEVAVSLDLTAWDAELRALVLSPKNLGNIGRRA